MMMHIDKKKAAVFLASVLFFPILFGCSGTSLQENLSSVHNSQASFQQNASGIQNSKQEEAAGSPQDSSAGTSGALAAPQTSSSLQEFINTPPSSVFSSGAAAPPPFFIPSPSSVDASPAAAVSETAANPEAPPATPAQPFAPQPATDEPTPPESPMPSYTPPPSSAIGSYVVGYYASWSRYNGFMPDKIDASKVTHINYAFASIGEDLTLCMGDPGVDTANFAGLRDLKSRNPSLKSILSVGGWDDSKRFSDAAYSASSREIFAQSCLDFILEHGFDGIDIDWEYPVSGGAAGNTKRPEDKQNLTRLLGAIRQKFNEQSARDGKPYYLTMAGATTKEYLNKIELSSVLSLVDYIFIMNYDLHGPWDKYADFNAPLHSPQEASPQYKISVKQGVLNYINAGAPADKLVLGMPFYGYRYEGTDSSNNGLYSPFTAAKAVTYNTVVSRYLNDPAYTGFYHSEAQVPYLFGNNTFISYDDPQSIAQKAGLAKSFGLAGVGAWELSQDSDGALLTSAYHALH